MRSVSEGFQRRSSWRYVVAAGSLMLAAVTTEARAQAKPSVEIYGFAMADAIYDFMQNNPDWYDTNRPSRLPKFEGEFGRNGRTWISPRQSRFGARATLPTASGDIKGVFEFDMFGVGRDA